MADQDRWPLNSMCVGHQMHESDHQYTTNTTRINTDYAIHILGACSHIVTCKEYYDHSQVHVCACVFQVWSVRDGVFVDKIHKQETISLANKV